MLLKAVACLAAVVISAVAWSAPPQEPRLNVLFLIADDLNNDLGVYGAPVRSLNIDKLAARGVRFDRAYNQYPLCSPSRSSFLTGRRPNVTGVLTNPNPAKNPNSPHFREKLPAAVTLPQLFRANGWFAARVGKLYHYGVPLSIGTGGLDDYPSWDFTINPRGRDREVHDRIFSLRPGQFGGTVSWLADEGADAAHTDGIAAAEAVKLLERFKRTKQPFFLAVGFYRPHTPYVAPRNTIVVFTSDHGYHLGDHGLWQKMSVFERSARVPLIIAVPNATARGAAARGLAELVDLYPTLADLAGLTPAGALDGVSLAPILRDPSATVKDAAFTQVRNGYSIRTDRWRYIEWAEGQQGAQLYDMNADPGETTNLASHPRHADTVKDLRARLAAYRVSARPSND